MPAPKRTVVTRNNDPYIYLYIMGEWYCYNPAERLLGSGAMGDVFLGYRCKNGEPVAVKRVKDVYANNPMIRQRARQEASLAFRHDNLVEMVGICEYAPDHGPIFMVSHFVQGIDSDQYVKSLPDSDEREAKIARNIICPVLDALDYVHSRGVIHRDIKPSNIMVEQDSNVRLMDLGISRMSYGEGSQSGFIGTPEYSAPEQIKKDEGQQGVINATTDIYQLGITMYELLDGTNPMSCDAEADTLDRQTKTTLPQSDRISDRMMDVIWKATAKKQAYRFQTAMEFKNAILAALRPEPPWQQRFADWLQDHFLVIIGIIVGVAVAFFIMVLLLT